LRYQVRRHRLHCIHVRCVAFSDGDALNDTSLFDVLAAAWSKGLAADA
jgi:hypothetical protein